FMGALFLPLVFVNPAAMRVVQYFSLYIMLLMPSFISCFGKKLQTPVYTVMVVVLLVMTNVYRYSYAFFWQ
ncbi:MAG: EpsG family protein, partial [Candidatus Fimenecus sp.]